MLDARALVHDAGFFDPLKRALAEMLREHSPDAAPRILDAGCGTGHYTETALDAFGAARPAVGGTAAVVSETGEAPRVLAMDLSPAAVLRTVRRRPASVDGLVADTWQPLPIRDASIDVVLDVFAPRNATEFRRVLRPGGLLLVVVPRPEHLQELRAEGRVLQIPEGKADSLVDELAPAFRLRSAQHVGAQFPLEQDAAADDALAAAIIAMGPSAHHRTQEPAAGALALPEAISLSVDVLALEATA
ncbi:methyltransferase domain-containing protein [Agromyces mediolanus]|uniref:methyltransferase domain-containing protein n=1 Tax=Agromyces mediolanus TaxID=41986 RepID=UPI0038386748